MLDERISQANDSRKILLSLFAMKAKLKINNDERYCAFFTLYWIIYFPTCIAYNDLPGFSSVDEAMTVLLLSIHCGCIIIIVVSIGDHGKSLWFVLV